MTEDDHREPPATAPANAASHEPPAEEAAGLPADTTAGAFSDSERRYRELVEYSLGLICTHDLTGKILSINPAAANSLGYRPQDGIGRNLREFLAPDKRDLFDDYLRRIQTEGHDAGMMRVIARDGTYRVWLYRNVLSHAPDGTPYVLGHAIDVTDRIAVERTLRESEQALRTAQAELEARVKERTLALELANERLRVEIVERKEAERSRERASVEQRDTLAFLANLSDRLAALVTFEELLEVVRRLPVPFLADWTMVHLVNEDGSVRPQPGVHADPADESALAALARSAPGNAQPSAQLAQVIASGQLALRTWQTEAVASDLVGAGVPAAALERIAARGAAMLPLVVDGRVKAVLSLFSRTAHRFEYPGLLVVEDVARRIRLALERIQLYREAQEANRLKDEFLSTLSHELRTPLNAIFGWARILRSRDLDQRTAHAVDVIQRNAEAQIRLIEEVLDVSRIITGKMTLAMDVVDVASLVRATLDTIRPALHAKRIRLVERISETPPVIADAHRLQQVFWNMLSNAVKFTGNDGVITVTVRRLADSVEFEV